MRINFGLPDPLGVLKEWNDELQEEGKSKKGKRQKRADRSKRMM